MHIGNEKIDIEEINQSSNLAISKTPFLVKNPIQSV